jgi:hypothetical protein
MQPETSIHERLNLLIDYFAKGNKAAFAKEIGTLPSVIASIIGGRMSKPSFELLEKITLRYSEISGDWLLTGKGAMTLPEPPDRVYMPSSRGPIGHFGGSPFIPAGYLDPLAEFYEQRPIDLKYILELVDFIAQAHPSPKLLQFQDRLPYTINPDFEPEGTDPLDQGNRDT